MNRYLGCAILCGFLATCGCYVNRAAFSPFSYAPISHSSYWESDTTAKEMTLSVHGDQPEIEYPPQKIRLSLAEVLDLALKNNTQTQKSWSYARQKAAEYGQSQSYNMPRLDGDFSFRRYRSSFLSTQVEPNMRGPTELITANYNEWGPQFQLFYLIFDFGEGRAESNSARFALYFADYIHNRTIQTVVQTITTDYYDFLYQKKLLAAYQEDLRIAQEVLDAATLSLQHGIKDQSDVLLAKTQFLQTEIELIAQRQQVNTSFATLLTDMGLPASCSFEVQDFPDVTKKEYCFLSLDEYLDLALEHRPDYLAAKADVQSKTEYLNATLRERLPKLSYTLDFGRTYWSGGFNDKYDYTSVISVSMPLFAGFYYSNNIKAAEEKKREAESSLRQVKLDVIKDVSTAHFNIQVANDTLKAAFVLLDAAKEQFHAAIKKYNHGVNTILDVNSAQSSLADARSIQASAMQKWFNSLATLSYSIGLISKNPEQKP